MEKERNRTSSDPMGKKNLSTELAGAGCKKSNYEKRGLSLKSVANIIKFAK